MKIRSDIVRLYKDVHGWAGVLCGLFLFTAFFAGAVTMFAAPLERWLSVPVALSPAPDLAATPELIAAVLKTHPEVRSGYTVQLATDAASPARLIWQKGGRMADPDEAGPAQRFAASLSPDGTVQVAPLATSPAAKFIDILHQQAGLPLGHETAMIFVGVLCLLYTLALISGLIVLLPSLVKDLFAMRLGQNIKRKWLDLHNALGLFSLPFHLIMALTTVVFAFHGLFYGAQNLAFYGGKIDRMWDRPAAPVHAAGTPLLPPQDIVGRLAVAAPGFVPTRLEYSAVKARAGRAGAHGGRSAPPVGARLPAAAMSLRVWGADPRYGTRAVREGFAMVDPYDGHIVQSRYLPGHQDGWYATLTAFFALHFGSYGGLGVRWGYCLLGLAGAFLFYTGNVLWVETRRRRNGGQDTATTRLLARLTAGWVCGTICGISLLLVAARGGVLAGILFPPAAVFYPVFLLCVGGALWQPFAGMRRLLYGLAAVSSGGAVLLFAAGAFL